VKCRELKILFLRNNDNFADWKARVCVLVEFMIMSALWKEPIHSRSVPGRTLGIVDQDPSDSKSNRYMLTSSGFFIHFRYILL
jgi:hypothetical protein